MGTEPITELLAEASANHGVFTRAEARARGLSDRAIDRRVSSGLWVPVHRGVFTVAGAPLTWYGRVAAAVASAGEGAAAARTTALHLHGVDGERPPRRVEVVVPYARRTETSDSAVLPHRSRTLLTGDVLTVEGIAATSVERAWADVAGERRPAAFRRLTTALLRTGLTSQGRLYAQLERSGNVRGAGLARRTLAGIAPGTERANSGAEVEFVDLFASAGLPPPVINYPITDTNGAALFEIDAAYPPIRLGYELNSLRWHGDADAILKDQVRTLTLSAREDDWMVVPVPVALVRRTPRKAADLIRAVLLNRLAQFELTLDDL